MYIPLLSKYTFVDGKGEGGGDIRSCTIHSNTTLKNLEGTSPTLNKLFPI